MKLPLILFFLVFTAVGQNIKGTIYDNETQKPLEDVNVYFFKGKTGTATNKKGEFKLSIASKLNPIDVISFTNIGYEPKYYTLLELKKLNFIVQLSKKTETLDEITVTANQKLKFNIQYKKLAPLIKGVYNFGATSNGKKIYIVGGNESYLEDAQKRALNEAEGLEDLMKKLRNNFTWESYNNMLQVYDLKSDTWESLKLNLGERAYHNIVYLNDEIYVLGGKTLSTNRKKEYLDNKIEILDINTKQIVVDDTNPHQAVNFASFSHQDNIIVMGGSVRQNSNGLKTYTDQSHIYNVTTGYWYELPKMTKPKEVSGVLIKNKIYLIGGFNEKPLSEIESYDLISGIWNKEGELFNGIENPALASNSGVIYIFNNTKIMTYNIENKLLNEYNIDLRIKNAKMYCYNNKLYILGGLLNNTYTELASSNLYSIDLNEFAKTRIINSKNN
jgi:hypothetical protein